jgi:hypothetical protein
MNHQTETAGQLPEMLRFIMIWIATIYGSITLQQIVLLLTGIYTILQIVILIRDKFLNKPTK